MEHPKHDGESANGYGDGDIEKQIVVVHLDFTPGHLAAKIHCVAHPARQSGREGYSP
jgi:hypothetical protein